MAQKICGLMPPRGVEIVGHSRDGYGPECILPHNHNGKHVFKSSRGEYSAWEDDWTCDCCGDDETNRCYT